MVKKSNNKRTVSQLGGSFLYAGKIDSNMKGGQLCNFEDNYINSEIVGTEGFKYGDCADFTQSQSGGGDGYSLLPEHPINGQVGFMRYSDNCKPVFPGEILPKKVGGGSSKKQNGIISSIFDNKITKFKNRNIKDIYKECNSDEGDAPKMKGGNLLNEAVNVLSSIIFPMDNNSLIALVVLLITNHFVYLKKTKKSTKTKKGGDLTDYFNIFLPMSKNNLLTLASILLIHYFVKNKNKKIQKGGALFTEISNILAPLGVNQFGTSVILLLLNQAVNFKTAKTPKTPKSKKKGGSFENPLVELIAPLGLSAFISTGILTILNEIFKKKNDPLNIKTKKGGDPLTKLTAKLSTY